MHIFEVKGSADKKEFIRFAKVLYSNDQDWVCPLDSEVEAVFSPAENNTFKHGVAARWILKDEKQKTIGRIAAFIDFRRSEANNQPTGGIGYFEVTDNREAAFKLFDTAKNWLEARGMEAMDGPVNFGENDNNWGLLDEGFMQQVYGMPYNKKYYRQFFEDYGFQKYFEQYSYHVAVRKPDNQINEFPDRMMKIAAWLTKRPGYSFRHFEFSRKSRYANDLVEIYNSAWSVFKEDFTPLEAEFFDAAISKAKVFVDEELIWFAYYYDRPIAFFILYPDLNQIIKHFNGRLHLWNKLRFLYFKNTHKMSWMRAVAGGVHPSHQNSGIESAIFLQLYNVFRRKRWYRELELSWVGDFNPKMIAIYEALGAKRTKTHLTYRYMINKNLNFRRYMEEITDRLQKNQ
jgi:GNAT superfamily N-acetyltransferase